MGTPHKHAALIKAWADGAEIQWRSESHPGWEDAKTPNWYDNFDYRIKPLTKVKKYRYVYKLANNSPCLTNDYYKDAEELQRHMDAFKNTMDWCERIQQTVTEF